MHVIISNMDYSHLEAVARIEEESFSTPWSINAFRDAIDSPNYEYVVACEEDGTVLGYAGMQVVLDEAEITNIAVSESARGNGIAHNMLEALYRLCVRRGVIYLHLEVRQSNAPARHLYEKNGFNIDGVRKNFYDRPKEDAVLMTKIMEENSTV